MRFEAALAHLEAGKRLRDHTHVERAAAVFAEIGAEFNLNEARSLLRGGAPMNQEGGKSDRYEKLLAVGQIITSEMNLEALFPPRHRTDQRDHGNRDELHISLRQEIERAVVSCVH